MYVRERERKRDRCADVCAYIYFSFHTRSDLFIHILAAHVYTLKRKERDREKGRARERKEGRDMCVGI